MADSVKKQKVDVKGKVVNIRIDMDDQFYVWKSGAQHLVVADLCTNFDSWVKTPWILLKIIDKRHWL
jgi:hypothetical protein